MPKTGQHVLPTPLVCRHFVAADCRSCTLIEVPYSDQLTGKDRLVREQLATRVAPEVWLPPAGSAAGHFRTKAKLVVGGRKGAVTLGITDTQGRGVDLPDCLLYEPAIEAAIGVLRPLINAVGLTPYDISTKNGELKYVLITSSPQGQLMVRFVLRSMGQAGRVVELADQVRQLPEFAVISINEQPLHAALLEGPTETIVSEQGLLPLGLPGATLMLPPGAFVQTNTGIATQLYAQATDWVAELDVHSIWDLYCGIGGFAMHLAGSGREVVGVEVNEPAIEGALAAAVAGTRFICADAQTWAEQQGTAPDLVVVNPPRRGLGPLAQTLAHLEPRFILYSSCHPASLAADLVQLPGYEVLAARMFDMFPHTEHAEVAVLMERASPQPS